MSTTVRISKEVLSDDGNAVKLVAEYLQREEGKILAFVGYDQHGVILRFVKVPA